MNRIKLGGNLGGDVELRSTRTGTPVASLRMATGKRYTDRSGVEREEVQWHTVVVWGDLALQCAELTRGTRVDVEGELKYRAYEDREGVERMVAEVHALSVTATRRMSVARREEVPAGADEAPVGGARAGGGRGAPDRTRAAVAGRDTRDDHFDVAGLDDDLPF